MESLFDAFRKLKAIANFGRIAMAEHVTYLCPRVRRIAGVEWNLEGRQQTFSHKDGNREESMKKTPKPFTEPNCLGPVALLTVNGILHGIV